MSQFFVGGSGGGGGTPIQTINGDVGSISGSSVTIFANQATNQAGSSVRFVNSGTVSTLDLTDSVDNVMLGAGSGNLTITGSDNIGIGTSTMQALTTGSINTAIGSGALGGVDTGDGNCAIGNLAGAQIDGGSFNITIGVQAGQNYTTTESSNICVSNSGVISESNTLRLGTNGTGGGAQNRCFIAGIQGVTTAQDGAVTINTTSGQLANVLSGSSGNVLISNGTNWTSGPVRLPTLSLSMTTVQSLTQNALVDVIYDTVMVDTASGYSAGVYTIPTTGNWFFNVVGQFDSTGPFINCDIIINKNSGTFLTHTQSGLSVSAASVVTVNGGGVFPMVAGDTIKLSVFAQTTGGTNYDVLGFANGYYNTFSAYQIS